LFSDENPADFDMLSAQELSQLMDHLNKKYYIIHKSVSGDHGRFANKVGEKAHLMYFNLMINETCGQDLKDLTITSLSGGVFGETSISGFASLALSANPIEAGPKNGKPKEAPVCAFVDLVKMLGNSKEIDKKILVVVERQAKSAETIAAHAETLEQNAHGNVYV
jgi:hypothetical protein